MSYMVQMKPTLVLYQVKQATPSKETYFGKLFPEKHCKTDSLSGIDSFVSTRFKKFI